MDIENKEYIEELLSSLATDQNSRQKLLQLYAKKMYKEAQLYISEKEAAKETCMRAFNRACSSLNNAKAEDVWPVLKKAVQDECVRTVVIEDSDTAYTTSDEVPDDETFAPENTEKVYSALRKLLRNLSGAQRLIAVLKYRDGLSFSTIADKLNITETQTKGILQDAKNSLKEANTNMGLVFAMVKKLFPYYDASEQEEGEPFLEERYSTAVKDDLTEEERFTKTLEEIEAFFETAEIEKNRESESAAEKNADDSDLRQDTMELQTVDDSDDVDFFSNTPKPLEESEKTGNILKTPYVSWGIRIAVILALLLIGIGAGSVISRMLRKEAEPVNTPVPTESAEPERDTASEEPETTEEPEETPEPDDGVIGSAYILVTDLTIRTGPGVAYEQNGLTEPETTYDVLEIAQADGYTWYRVGEGMWVADYEGQYVTYTPKE